MKYIRSTGPATLHLPPQAPCNHSTHRDAAPAPTATLHPLPQARCSHSTNRHAAATAPARLHQPPQAPCNHSTHRHAAPAPTGTLQPQHPPRCTSPHRHPETTAPTGTLHQHPQHVAPVPTGTLHQHPQARCSHSTCLSLSQVARKPESMDRVMLALLGGLLLCTGIPAGQATEAGSTVEDSSPPPVLQTANYSADGATPEAPVADDYSSSPFVGDTDATSTPPTTTTGSTVEDSSPPPFLQTAIYSADGATPEAPVEDDYSSSPFVGDTDTTSTPPTTTTEPFTSTMTTQYPYYPTTGRCGTEPRLCCLGRNDSCRRINCYCDEACYQAFSDCCSDYKAVCKNGQFTTGFGSPTTGSLAGSTLPGDTDEPTPDQFNTGFGSPTTGSLAGSTLPGDTDGPTPGPTTGNQYSSKAQPSTADTLYPTGSTTEQNGNSDCVPTEPGRKFPLLCSGQRNNLIRRCDLYGCGCYGSPRGHSLLKGVDVVCRDGATVYAPFTGTVMSLDGSYGDENDLPSGEGFMFVGSGLCLKIFNVHQDGQSGEITKGCRMGTLIPMQLKYPRITSHMHVQKCDLSDPTGLLS